MKIALSILGLALVSLFSAPAQVVSVQLTLEQEQFLPGETLPVTVHIVNNSGQSLHLGADAKWLTFTVESVDDNFAVMKNGDPPVTGEFNLGSSEMATKRVDLTPYFAMTHAGRYRAVATVHIPEWGADVTSPAKEFDIIDGARLWSQDFGMPVPAGVTNQPPVVRKYILEEANYLRQQLRMYVLVSDQSGARILKVSAIGPMVSFSRPEAQLDRLSNLHVLYQSGAQSFIYSVVNPDGNITQQEIYDYLGTRPRLAVNDAGDIVVKGGVRRVKSGELPVVKTPDELSPTPASAPAKP
jgi:hypothetical protein